MPFQGMCAHSKLFKSILLFWGKGIRFSVFGILEKSLVKSVQSALSDLKCVPERLQSQCNYWPFIT